MSNHLAILLILEDYIPLQEIHGIRRNLIGDFDSAFLSSHVDAVDSAMNDLNTKSSSAIDSCELQLMPRGVQSPP
ncbi:hypothetical protein RIF29_14899 [Crotalaria pallida]|uniref:Uncharacterized protein n=1 Tax=Crotalaria pallida TaxID=3830 RepID=A0AAN9IE57_CROPI